MTDSRQIRIHAPSRLHFGLLSFNNPQSRQFGGVGMMIKQPGITLSAAESDDFACAGLHADRVRQFVECWADFHNIDLPHLRLDVAAAPPQHVGLGVGTQLGLATAAILSQLILGRRDRSEMLARSVGRGRRSSIGTHGFDQGGLLFELGKSDVNDLSALERRVPVPDDWRIVLIRPQAGAGLSGSDEQLTFRELPPVPVETTQRLIREVNDNMLPALEAADFHRFSSSVTDYGELAGRCFESVQGGPYANQVLQENVEMLQEMGVAGVGQSSWGPTLFAFANSPENAANLVAEYERLAIGQTSIVEVCSPCNDGAVIEVA